MKMSNNLAKYEVLINQYLSSILDVSEKMTQVVLCVVVGIWVGMGSFTSYQTLPIVMVRIF